MPPLALADDPIPNEVAIALSPTMGWIMLACVVCTIGIFLVHREGWRRLWLRAEDPRPMAVFRILFGLTVLGNINGLADQFEFLFTDEGIFLTDVARQVRARGQFEGFGNGLDGDPYGFFDLRAFLQWLKGPNYSLLLFWDSPAAFWIHLVAFEIATAMLIVGLWTRYTKWIAWFLFHGIILRNALFWEGTENVYRTFYFYLCLSACDRAYSVDNWLRCRRLRRLGRLSERGGPGDGAGAPPSPEHPQGLAAIYRLIPAWPRLLVILQIAAIYCYTGSVKNGGVWLKGDAFYYALNLDHFYRFPPQQISAIFGTNLFRLNTWVSHWWEACFPLVVVGLVIRWARRERLPEISRGERWLSRAAWVGFGLGALALTEVSYPVHYVMPRAGWPTLEQVELAIGIGWVLIMILIGWGYHRLQHRPFSLRGGRVRIDADDFCRWVLGRRLWLSLGIAFHLHLIIMMNIGWFSPCVLAGYVCFLNGSELSYVGRLIGSAIHRLFHGHPRRWGAVAAIALASSVATPWLDAAAMLALPTLTLLVGWWVTPAHVRRGEPALPAEDGTLPWLAHDDRRLPITAMTLALLTCVAGVFLDHFGVLHVGWSLSAAFAMLLGFTIAGLRRPAGELPVVPPGAPGRPSHAISQPWAYGPLGRFLANALVVYQITGVAAWLLPDKDCLKQWRGRAHDPFRWWLEVTQTTQGWKMFAPNPPRANLFMKVLVTTVDGETYDLNTDMYHPDKRPIPWIWYTRERKMNRRIVGAEGGNGEWYQKWHGRYVCRRWALTHDGELPEKVDLVKVNYGIPSPEWVRDHGPYVPEERMAAESTQSYVLTVRCADEIDAQPPTVLAERHGVVVPHKVRRWNQLRGKKAAWDRKHKKEEDEEEAEPVE